jgi:MFS family permease
MWSLMNAIIGPLAPEFSRARWASIPQAIGMFSSTIAPFIGGVLYDVSPRYPFTIAIATMLVLSLLVATKIFDKA